MPIFKLCTIGSHITADLQLGTTDVSASADIADEAEGQTDQIAGSNRKMDDLVEDLQPNN